MKSGREPPRGTPAFSPESRGTRPVYSTVWTGNTFQSGSPASEVPTSLAARMWHTLDSQGQILALAFRERPFKPCRLFSFLPAAADPSNQTRKVVLNDATQWSKGFSWNVNLHHAVNFRALCGSTNCRASCGSVKCRALVALLISGPYVGAPAQRVGQSPER